MREFFNGEIEYCYRRKDPFSHLAARFAAKEAALKAFGLKSAKGIKWTDVEVIIKQSKSPEVNLSSLLNNIAEEKKIKHVMLSNSCGPTYRARAIGNR